MKYQVESGLRATEDFVAAISYIFENVDMLRVSTDDYSLGGSYN